MKWTIYILVVLGSQLLRCNGHNVRVTVLYFVNSKSLIAKNMQLKIIFITE